MSDNNSLKTLPALTSDEDAERFLDEADLTEYDLSDFKSAGFEFEKNSAWVNICLPGPLLDAVKARAQARGMPYQHFIREAIERALDHRES